MMRDEEDDDSDDAPNRPPAYNEERFESKIEEDLGYEIEDPHLKDQISQVVYNPKPKPEFGFDPTVLGPGSESSEMSPTKLAAPLAAPVVFKDTPSVSEDVKPTNLVASSLGYVMPKNLGDAPAEDDEEDIENKYGYNIQAADSGDTEDDDGYKPYSALDTVEETPSEYNASDDGMADVNKAAAAGARSVGNNMDRIKVCVRLRPMTKEEMISKNKKKKEPEAFYGWNIGDDGDFDVMIQKGVRSKVEGKNMFHIDRVYEAQDFLEALYSDICAPITKAVITGRHGTIFGYGATGGGKSFTIQGGKGSDGIIQLAAKDLFDKIAEDMTREYTVKASYFEIYNEQVRDLMGKDEEETPKSRRATAVVTTVNKLNIELPVLNIREDSKTGEVTVDAQSVKVSNMENITRVLHKGNRNRATEKTESNKFSSRSHAIFRLTVESHERLEGDPDAVEGVKLRVAALNFVDLAGSENSAKASTSGSRKREGGKINQSLLSLSQVIHQLSLPKKKQPKHINFRDSKLTRILQPQLSGNAAMSIICCASPAKKCVEETRQTLKFAFNAKRIRMRPQVNEILDEKVLIENLKKELQDMRIKLREVQENYEKNPPAPPRPPGSEFPMIERFMAQMSASVRTVDFMDALEDLSDGSGFGAATATTSGGSGGSEASDGGGGSGRGANDVGGGDSTGGGGGDAAPAAEEEDEDDVEAFRRQILAKFMMEMGDEDGGEVVEDEEENADATMNDTTANDTTANDTTVNDTTVNDTTVNDTTVNDTTVNDTTVNDTTFDDGGTTGYDTSVNRTMTDATNETAATREANEPRKSETKDISESSSPDREDSNFNEVFRSRPEEPTKPPAKEPAKDIVKENARSETSERSSPDKSTGKYGVEETEPAATADSAKKKSFYDDEGSSGIQQEPPHESDLNLIEKFREEILEKFRDEIVDEEAAHELDENAQNVAVIANELISKFKKEIVFKFKDDFPDIFGKRVKTALSATRVGENGIVGRVIEGDAAGLQSTDDSSGSDGDGSGGGSVEKFEDEFEEEARMDDGEPQSRRSVPKRNFSTKTDRAVVSGKVGGAKMLSRTETEPSTAPMNSLEQGTSGSVSSDLSSDVVDRDKGSDMSPAPANPPGDDDDQDGLIPPSEIAIGKGLKATGLAPGLLDGEMRIKFLEEKLAATDELVETLFVELENAKTFIRELVYENAGNGIDQSGAALFGPAGTSGVTVVDEQILNQCEILKFAIYTSLLFFVFGQHELFLATVFFLWLSLEVATKT